MGYFRSLSIVLILCNLHYFDIGCPQISDYNSAKSDFGTELAISTRTELDPGDCCIILIQVIENSVFVDS